jgi:hypothetical protein
MSGLVAGGSVLVHALAMRAERVARVKPLAGDADDIAAACGGQLYNAGPLLARAAVHLAGGGSRARRDGRGHVGRGGVEPGVRERAERFGQGDDFGGRVQARRGPRHRPFETEPD